MLDNDGFGDCQSETGATRLSASRILDAVERFEDPFEFSIRDARPVVEYLDENLCSIRLDMNRGRVSVLQGIADDIPHRPLHGDRFSQHRRVLDAFQGDRLSAIRLAIHDCPDHGREIEGLRGFLGYAHAEIFEGGVDHHLHFGEIIIDEVASRFVVEHLRAKP